jgi:large subunit ribosomal protein L15
MPKVGFTNTPFKTEYEILNLNQLGAFNGTVGPEELAKAGLVSKQARVKILGRGDAPKGLTVRAHKFSETAKAALEKAGGKVEVI